MQKNLRHLAQSLKPTTSTVAGLSIDIFRLYCQFFGINSIYSEIILSSVHLVGALWMMVKLLMVLANLQKYHSE